MDLDRATLCRARLWLASVACVAAACAACSSVEPRTEVLVTVDAEPGVRAAATRLRIEVYTGAGRDERVPTTLREMREFPVSGATGWPRRVGVVPLDGDATRIYRIVGIASDSTTPEIAVARAISGFVPGKTLSLYLLLEDACIGRTCEDESQTCHRGDCIDAWIPPETLPEYNMDAGTQDGGAGEGGARDGGPDSGCSGGCDDHIVCTMDACTDGHCVSVAMDTLCGPGERCTMMGCQGACTLDSCMAMAGPCEMPRCVDGVCDPEPLCAAGQLCCGGACTDCDDGEPCTTDACDASGGCMHTPRTGTTCDDSLYCNGTDTCGSDGECSSHVGSPCTGSMFCREDTDACVSSGCTTDAMCGSESFGPWSTCSGFSDVCDMTGTQTRPHTVPRCSAGSCMNMVTDDTQACTGMPTDGLVCGMQTIGACGTCGGFVGACGEEGTCSRMVTTPTCRTGSCQPVVTTQVDACFRETDGMMLCGPPVYGGWSACDYGGSMCATTGMRWRSVTEQRCSFGSCAASMYTEYDTTSCNRVTDGNSCNDFNSCTSPDQCSGGVCRGPFICGDAGTGDSGIGFDAGTGDSGTLGDGGAPLCPRCTDFNAPCCPSRGICCDWSMGCTCPDWDCTDGSGCPAGWACCNGASTCECAPECFVPCMIVPS